MSLQNILVENDLTLYCGAINVAGFPAPNVSILSQSLVLYYNSLATVSKTLVFTKIGAPGSNGVVFVSIPASLIINSGSSTFYFDLSSLPGLSIYGTNAITQVVEIVNNNVAAYGRVIANPSNQRIEITIEGGGAFTTATGSNVSGLATSIILTYQHQDA